MGFLVKQKNQVTVLVNSAESIKLMVLKQSKHSEAQEQLDKAGTKEK
jgi:F0F1-type ATP synthase epsilon subunit